MEYSKVDSMVKTVNRRTQQQLRDDLAALHLDSRGVPAVLKKRLRNYHKMTYFAETGQQLSSELSTPYAHLLVIDFEATCERDVSDYNHEIIEFPVVVIDVQKRNIVAEFHEYVRPTINPTLTDFCTELTGITQDVIDQSDTFPSVLSHMDEWRREHEFHRLQQSVVVTDGPWDMDRFFKNQCHINGIQPASWARRWVNVRKLFAWSYGTRRLSLSKMLSSLGMEFAGRRHSGIDDARNIAQVCLRMLNDGCVFRINENSQSVKRATPKKVNSTDVFKTRKQTELERSLEVLSLDEDNGADPNDIGALASLYKVST